VDAVKKCHFGCVVEMLVEVVEVVSEYCRVERQTLKKLWTTRSGVVDLRFRH
jgi:hypothetical protein